MYLVIFSSNHAFLKPNKSKANYTGTDVFIVSDVIDRESSFTNLEFWKRNNRNQSSYAIYHCRANEFRGPEKYSLQPPEELIDLIEAEKLQQSWVRATRFACGSEK